MDWSMWTAPAATVLVGGLAYLGARAGARQRGRADERAEWRARFELALREITEGGDPRRLLIGRDILKSLAESSLATREDRKLADEILAREMLGARPEHTRTASADDLADGAVSRHNEDDSDLGGAR